jgi:hypothetical protein
MDSIDWFSEMDKRTLMRKTERKRFGLTDGQVKANLHHKNLWWHLNGNLIGFGDLDDDNILNIASNLNDDETFVGFREFRGDFTLDRVACIIRKGDLDLALRR